MTKKYCITTSGRLILYDDNGSSWQWLKYLRCKQGFFAIIAIMYSCSDCRKFLRQIALFLWDKSRLLPFCATVRVILPGFSNSARVTRHPTISLSFHCRCNTGIFFNLSHKRSQFWKCFLVAVPQFLASYAVINTSQGYDSEKGLGKSFNSDH